MMNFKIDFSSDESLYIQLRNQIILGIASGKLKEGESLPSVRQLADEIGINMHTVNKSYNYLRAEGLLKVDRRHGAVIAVEKEKAKAAKELKEDLEVTVAKGICKTVSREAAHKVIDEIYNKYEG
jgi:DNA-binding transcriptional regulator YhcF (GntR family)